MQISSGLPAFLVIGLPGKAVDDAGGRRQIAYGVIIAMLLVYGRSAAVRG